MKTRIVLLSLAALLACAVQAGAQQLDSLKSDSLQVDSLQLNAPQPVVEQPAVEEPVVEQSVAEQPAVEEPVVEQPVALQEAEEADAPQPEVKQREYKPDVWTRNVKYTNFGYEMQNISNGAETFKSEYGASLSFGRTYYLHKKPIAGLIKFGFDWTYLDIAAGKFGDDAQLWTAASQEEDGGLLDPDLGLGKQVYKAEVGMGFGLSLTVNPVDYLKSAVYFHATPSYSLLMQEVGVCANYATFFNLGLNVSYKVISLGFEYRWCGDTQYKELFSPEGLAEDIAGEGLVDAQEITYPMLSTSSARLYLSLRFGGKRR